MNARHQLQLKLAPWALLTVSMAWGASFVLMKPSLEILFSTKELVLTKPELKFDFTSITDYFNYYISTIIQEHSYERALVYVGLFIIITVFFQIALQSHEYPHLEFH